MIDKIVNVIFKQGSEGGDAARADVKKTYDEAHQFADKLDKQAAEHHAKASGRIKEHEGEISRLAEGVRTRMERIGEYIVAAFAIEGIKDFGKESLKVFADAEAAAKRLEFAVTKVNGGTTQQFKDLTKQSEELSTALNKIFTPKQIQNVQLQLANFGLTQNRIKQLTPLILDMSKATGHDLAESTQKVILAINGQTKGLRDVGIAFQDTGDKTKNYNLLLKDMTKFTGEASEASHTTQGELDSLSNSWELMQEDIGKTIANSGLLNWLGSIVSKIDEVIQGEDTLRAKAQEATNTREMKDFMGLTKQEQASQLQAEKETLKQYEDLQDQRVGIAANAQKRMDEIDKETRDPNASHKKIYDLGLEYQAQKKVFDGLQDSIKQTAPSVKGMRDLIDQMNAAMNPAADKDLGKTTKGDPKPKQEKQLKELKEFEDNKEELVLAKMKEGREKELEEETKKQQARLDKETEIYNEDVTLNDENLKNKVISQKKHDANLEQLEKDFGTQMGILSELDRINRDNINKKWNSKDYEEWEKAHKKEFDEKRNALIDTNKIEDAWRNDQLTSKKITQEQYDDAEYKAKLVHLQQLLDLEKQYGEKTADTILEISELKKSHLKDEIKTMKEYVKEFIELSNEVIEQMMIQTQEQIDANQIRINNQNTIISTQQALAQAGLKNDLAFEQKRANDMAAQQIQLQQKLKKEKELEAFLNAVAKFTETDPKTAVPKAIGLVAAMKVAEAVYAEEGGMVEDLTASGKKHRNPERLVRMEEGEGIFSRKEIMNMGGKDAFYDLKERFNTPSFFEKDIPQVALLNANFNTDPIVERLDKLEQAIVNKREVTVDWDELDNMVYTVKESGKKVTTTYKRRF